MPEPYSGSDCEAIVIGASAGGVEALSFLLPALPQGLRAPVLVVLHMAPGRASLLSGIFRERLKLPVLEAEDKLPLEPGTVYFAAADYHLLVEADRSCALSQDAPVWFSRPAIDVLFESAAVVYRRGLLGILLSGASSDGAQGLKAILAAGGHSWVQAPETAYASAMPSNAVNLGAAAEVMALEQMALRLRGFPGAPIIAA